MEDKVEAMNEFSGRCLSCEFSYESVVEGKMEAWAESPYTAIEITAY